MLEAAETDEKEEGEGWGGEGRGREGGAHPWFHRTHEGHRYLHRTY